MKILGDYHTHTIYSHGKGTILDNAKKAKESGLQQLGITDHAFGHQLYGMKRSKLPEMRANIKEAEEITGINLFLGAEANLTSIHGDIDITQSDLTYLDILLVGFHRFVKSSFLDKFRLFLPNIILKKVSKKQRAKNTKAIIMAMQKYPIDVLTHLGYGMNIDIEPIAKVAVKTNTYIELNEHKMCFSKQDIDLMLSLGVKFIIDSDAHISSNVGNTPKMLQLIKDWNIPPESIVNLDKLPKFKMQR